MLIPRRRFLQSTLVLGAGACFGSVALAADGPSSRASVADFGADATGILDATDAVRKAIASLPPANARLVFPAGTYTFNASSKAAMLFHGFGSIEVYANNAELRLSGATPAFVFNACDSVAVHDMKLEWTELPLAQRTAGRATSGFDLQQCKGILLDGLIMRHAPGTGFSLRNCSDIRLEDVTIAPSQENRVLTSTFGNAVHLQDCHGNIRVHACRFEGMGGNGVHVQQSYWRIRERLSDTSVVIQGNSDKTVEPWEIPQPGDYVQISSPATLQLLGEIEIAGVDIHKQGATLNFSETLSPVILSGMLISSVIDAPRVAIDHCVIGSNAGNGLVLHTRSEVMNCRFHDCGRAAILLAADARSMDGPVVQNVNIRDNTFEACNQGPDATARGAITIDTMHERAVQETPAFAVNSSIKIQANIFNGTAGPAIYAAGVVGLLIDGNIFGSIQKITDADLRCQPALILRNVADADVTGNTSTVPQTIDMLACAITVAIDGNQQLTARKTVGNTRPAASCTHRLNEALADPHTDPA